MFPAFTAWSYFLHELFGNIAFICILLHLEIFQMCLEVDSKQNLQ